MYKVNSIQIDRRNKGYFFVDILEADNEVELHIHEDVLISYGLRKDLELTKEQVKEIQLEGNQIKVYHLAINYLSYRMRSKREMEDYLVKKGFELSYIHGTIQRLVKENLLNDRMFAEAFVRTRMGLSTKGPFVILRELLKAGVSEMDGKDALSQYSFDQQVENATKFFEKKSSSDRGKHSNREEQSRLRRLLMQKGYSSDVITAVFTEKPDESKDDEWDALVYQGEKVARKYRQRFKGREFTNKTKQALYGKGFPIDLINLFLEQLEEDNETE